jgi:hypothetical protein
MAKRPLGRHSAAALEVPPDVKSGSGPGGPWRQQGRVSEAKHERGGGEGDGGGGGEDEDEEKDEAEGDEDRDAAPHEPRCMDPADPATRSSCPTSTK